MTRRPQRPTTIRTSHRLRRRRPFVTRLGATAVGALLGSACAVLAPPADEPPARAPELALGQWHKDSIDCRERSNCTDWFELQLEEAGRLRVEVYAPVGEGLPELRVELLSADGDALGEALPVGRSPQRIEELVGSGSYRVMVQGSGRKDLLSYEVVARMADDEPASPPPSARPTPPPPPPRASEPPEIEPTLVEVLEVEREAGEPVAVLIDAGAPMGIRPGLQGKLVDKGELIGRIEIIDVYDSGSRGKLLGPLAAPITIDTEVVLRIPPP